MKAVLRISQIAYSSGYLFLYYFWSSVKITSLFARDLSMIMRQCRILVMTAVKKPIKKTNVFVFRATELYYAIIRHRSCSTDGK